MTQSADVIIIGAGVIGTSIAYEMSKAGWSTLSLDRNTQMGHGSTAGSCAIIRMHYSTFEGTAFAWEGYHYWRDFREYLKAGKDEELAQFKECGCVVMRTETNAYLDRHLENSRTLDIPVEEWGADQIKQQLSIYTLGRYGPPKLTDHKDFGQASGEIGGGLYWPNAGYVTDPALSAQNIGAASAREGAQYRLGVEVAEILQSGGKVTGVRLSDGEELHAPVVINVAGPGSSHINAMAGVVDEMTIETRPLRQEVCHVPSPAGFDFENDGIIVSDSDVAVYVRPEHGNHILIGSEDPECDPHYWVESDTDYDRNFTDQWTTQVMRYGQRVPSLGIPSNTRGVVDLYDAATDWIPIYDKSSLNGFYMACGSSGNQYKNAPIAGKLMTALVGYCENGGDHDQAPLQYTLPCIDRAVDVGFYSRKRPINTESSFSVLG